MNKSKFLYLLLLSASILSCRKEMHVPKPEFQTLFGTWQLAYALETSTSDTLYPGTNIDTEQREFNSNGKTRRTIDGKQGRKAQYQFLKIDTSYLINFPGTDPDGFHFDFIGNDTLTLYLGCADCYVYTYSRVE